MVGMPEEVAELCHFCISLIPSINLPEQRNGQCVPSCPLFKNSTQPWNINGTALSICRIFKDSVSLIHDITDQACVRTFTWYKIPQILKLNFSLHVTLVELMLVVDFQLISPTV